MQEINWSLWSAIATIPTVLGISPELSNWWNQGARKNFNQDFVAYVGNYMESHPATLSVAANLCGPQGPSSAP